MRKKTRVIVQDSDKLSNILIQVDQERGGTTVFSNFDPWENLALIMEALALTAQKCIDEGIPKEKVDNAINEYLGKVLGTYGSD